MQRFEIVEYNAEYSKVKDNKTGKILTYTGSDKISVRNLIDLYAYLGNKEMADAEIIRLAEENKQ